MKQNKNKKKGKKKISKVSNVKIEKNKESREIEKDIEKKEDKESQKNRKVKRFVKIILAIGAGIFSVIEILPPIIELYHNIQISKTRFSLEKKVNQDDTLTWKICNLGEAISNATIYPIIYVTLFFYDEKKDEDVEITLEIPGYYDEKNYYYSSSDGTFYIKDEKETEMNDFIEKYSSLLASDEIGYIGDSITPYFTLNYKDYNDKKYNKIYTISDIDFIDDNSDREIYGDDFSQLKEISKIPNPDIIAPWNSDEACVISINYKSANTQKLIESEQEYEAYLGFAILDLINSKDKSVDEMLGEIILTKDGTAYIQDMEMEIQEEKAE